jgi:cell division protease FtsH
MSETGFRPREGHRSSTAKVGPSEERRPAPLPPRPPSWRIWLLVLGVMFTSSMLFGSLFGEEGNQLAYSEFLLAVDEGSVSAVTIDPDGRVSGELEDGSGFTSVIPTALDQAELTARLEASEVRVEATAPETSLLSVLFSFLPLLVFVGLFVWMGRRGKTALGGLGGFGRSKTKVFDTEKPKSRFTDVAGYEGVKQEVMEVVDFLKNPDRYTAAGARGPRGVLLVGPPGTGKTLMARAVAGEADVPFLSVTGSSFVEMFVGVGASRTRDLFEEARKRAPAIIFIDELDAIGQRRGGRGMMTNDEREQTLNQLLAEMDGFESSEGIVVLAATNRPETLDPALLRPGRFDRQVTVPLPTLTERQAILLVHARGKQLGEDVDLAKLARATPGFSGADLANLINEAAIFAVRDDRQVLSAADFDAARDRVLLGRRETSNAMLPDEKRSVAVHEAGHALTAALSEHADPVAKVTILPVGQALGVTHQLPLDERRLYSEHYLKDLLAVSLGGRAAELLVLEGATTGAANDLTHATRVATRMVRDFGMSTALGPVAYGSEHPSYLGEEQFQPRSYAEETQWVIDREVARLVSDAQDRATELLSQNRDKLDQLAELLLEAETVSGQVVYDLVGRRMPEHGEQGPPLVGVSAAAAEERPLSGFPADAEAGR